MMTSRSTAGAASDISFIRCFSKEFPSAVQIRLEENFRSTGHILDAANAVIAQDKKRLGKTLFTKEGRRRAASKSSTYRDAQAEASGIVAEILRAPCRRDRLGRYRILYRNNFLSRGFEEALMRARIPYVIVGDVGF